MNWIGKLDPNVILLAISGVGTVVTWVWHRLRGDKVDSASDLVDSILSNIAHELLSEYNGEDIASFLEKARARFEDLIWSVLEKRGLKRSPLLEPIVHLGVEKASAWLASQITDKGIKLAQARIPAQLDDLTRRAQEVFQAIKDAQSSSLVKQSEQFAKDMVEKVEDPPK